MAANLLPLLQRAKSLRRVVSAFTGAHEGKVYEEDWQGTKGKVPMTAARGHIATIMTLGLAKLAQDAPRVTFVHNFPGSVKTDLIRGDEGFFMQVVKYVFMIKMMLSNTYTPLREVGERHTFYCTSAKYPPRERSDNEEDAGISVLTGLKIARGVDGQIGSGVYTIDGQGESADAKVEEVLATCMKDGTVDRLWKFTESEFMRVTESLSI